VELWKGPVASRPHQVRAKKKECKFDPHVSEV